MLKIQEFARRGGVSIRALRHYDSLGLLKPSARSRSGYRLYEEADVERLRQILVLKFLGIPLTEIADALRSPSKLESLLKATRWAAKRKRARLNAMLLLLEQLEETPAPRRDWADLASFVDDVGCHTIPGGSPRKQELDAALQMIGERRLALNITQEEYELNRDVRAAIARGDGPDSPAGRALVARWRESIERFVGGDRRLRDALVLLMESQTSQRDSPYRAYLDRALRHAS